MQRGGIWFAATPGGGRPVLVLTRDPVADRTSSVVVAALTRTERSVVSELALTTADQADVTHVIAPFRKTDPMAFAQASDPPASQRQIQEMTEFLHAAGRPDDC